MVDRRTIATMEPGQFRSVQHGAAWFEFCRAQVQLTDNFWVDAAAFLKVELQSFVGALDKAVLLQCRVGGPWAVEAFRTALRIRDRNFRLVDSDPLGGPFRTKLEEFPATTGMNEASTAALQAARTGRALNTTCGRMTTHAYINTLEASPSSHPVLYYLHDDCLDLGGFDRLAVAVTRRLKRGDVLVLLQQDRGGYEDRVPLQARAIVERGSFKLSTFRRDLVLGSLTYTVAVLLCRGPLAGLTQQQQAAATAQSIVAHALGSLADDGRGLLPQDLPTLETIMNRDETRDRELMDGGVYALGTFPIASLAAMCQELPAVINLDEGVQLRLEGTGLGRVYAAYDRHRAPINDAQGHHIRLKVGVYIGSTHREQMSYNDAAFERFVQHLSYFYKYSKHQSWLLGLKLKGLLSLGKLDAVLSRTVLAQRWVAGRGITGLMELLERVARGNMALYLYELSVTEREQHYIDLAKELGFLLNTLDIAGLRNPRRCRETGHQGAVEGGRQQVINLARGVLFTEHGPPPRVARKQKPVLRWNLSKTG